MEGDRIIDILGKSEKGGEERRTLFSSSVTNFTDGVLGRRGVQVTDLKTRENGESENGESRINCN